MCRCVPYSENNSSNGDWFLKCAFDLLLMTPGIINISSRSSRCWTGCLLIGPFCLGLSLFRFSCCQQSRDLSISHLAFLHNNRMPCIADNLADYCFSDVIGHDTV